MPASGHVRVGSGSPSPPDRSLSSNARARTERLQARSDVDFDQFTVNVDPLPGVTTSLRPTQSPAGQRVTAISASARARIGVQEPPHPPASTPRPVTSRIPFSPQDQKSPDPRVSLSATCTSVHPAEPNGVHERARTGCTRVPQEQGKGTGDFTQQARTPPRSRRVRIEDHGRPLRRPHDPKSPDLRVFPSGPDPLVIPVQVGRQIGKRVEWFIAGIVCDRV
jgi:hypothetical protein